MAQNFLYMFEFVVDDLLLTRPNKCAPDEYPTCCEISFRSSVFVAICDREYGCSVDLCAPKNGKCCLFSLESPVTDKDRLIVHVYKKKNESCKFLLGAADMPIKPLFDKVTNAFDCQNPTWMEATEQHNACLPDPRLALQRRQQQRRHHRRRSTAAQPARNPICDEDFGRKEQFCSTSEMTKNLLPLFSMKGTQTGNLMLITRLVCNGPAIVSTFPFTSFCPTMTDCELRDSHSNNKKIRARSCSKRPPCESCSSLMCSKACRSSPSCPENNKRNSKRNNNRCEQCRMSNACKKSEEALALCCHYFNCLKDDEDDDDDDDFGDFCDDVDNDDDSSSFQIPNFNFDLDSCLESKSPPSRKSKRKQKCKSFSSPCLKSVSNSDCEPKASCRKCKSCMKTVCGKPCKPCCCCSCDCCPSPPTTPCKSKSKRKSKSKQCKSVTKLSKNTPDACGKPPRRLRYFACNDNHCCQIADPHFAPVGKKYENACLRYFACNEYGCCQIPDPCLLKKSTQPCICCDVNRRCIPWDVCRDKCKDPCKKKKSKPKWKACTNSPKKVSSTPIRMRCQAPDPCAEQPGPNRYYACGDFGCREIAEPGDKSNQYNPFYLPPPCPCDICRDQSRRASCVCCTNDFKCKRGLPRQTGGESVSPTRKTAGQSCGCQQPSTSKECGCQKKRPQSKCDAARNNDKCDCCDQDSVDDCESEDFSDDCQSSSSSNSCCLQPCYIEPTRPDPGPESYEEFEACLNGTGLTLRVLKDTHKMESVYDGTQANVNESGSECFDQPPSRCNKEEELNRIINNSQFAKNSLRRRTAGRIVNNSRIPPIRATLKHAGADMGGADTYKLPLSKIQKICSGGGVNKLDEYRKRMDAGDDCGPIVPPKHLEDTRSCCLQVDPCELTNMLRGINVDARKKGIEVCYKSCEDTESDIFLVKLGTKKSCERKQHSIEIELKTPKMPFQCNVQKCTTETQIKESELDLALGRGDKGKGKKGKGKKGKKGKK